MKTITNKPQLLLLVIMMLLIVLSATGQSPNAFKYQAIARDSEGDPLANQNVSFLITILQGSESGTEVYAESHTVTTNSFGLANLELGRGTAESSSNFESIAWSNGPYFIKIAMDPEGGTAYQDLGTSPLLSVPYAMHAVTADSLANNSDTDPDPANEIQELSAKNDSLFISKGNGIPLDIDSANELQQLSALNDSLFISDGNGIPLDVDSTNELQSLSVLNDSLFISDVNGVPLTDLVKDESVNSEKIQNGTILAEDLKEGVGIAQGRTSNTVTNFNNSTMQDLILTTITIPGPGYIFLTGRAMIQFNSSNATTGQGFTMQIDEQEGGLRTAGFYSFVLMDEFPSGGFYESEITSNRTYFKDEAGTYTFRLEGNEFINNPDRTVTIFWPILTAIYIPTSLGSVQTLRLSASGARLSADKIAPAGQAPVSIQSTDLRQLELNAVKAQLEAEKATRELREAQLRLKD